MTRRKSRTGSESGRRADGTVTPDEELLAQELALSNADLGRLHLLRFIKLAATRAGIDATQIPEEFAAMVIDGLSQSDVARSNLATAEKGLRLAARGRYEEAGKVIRESIALGARDVLTGRLAVAGANRKKAERHLASAGKRQSQARALEWALWRDEAEQVRAKSPKKLSTTAIAKIVKSRLKLTVSIRTIRRRI